MPKKSMFYDARPDVFKKAYMLRKNETEAEALLWTRLRKNQLDGFRFKRQHPIANYVADFYCHKAKLVIEVDEKHHSNRQQALHDKLRTTAMEALGLTVLRFSDREVNSETEKVISTIQAHLAKPGT